MKLLDVLFCLLNKNTYRGISSDFVIAKKRFSDKNLFHNLFHILDDDDDDVKVYEDKCSVTYETAYEEQCRTEQEQVSQDDNGDGDDDCHRHDRLVCPADDGLGHEDSDNGDDDIIKNESE